ncbi:MAG: antitoxin, partial [Hyphomicrobiales bacterium]|nr:antitoxin [Hyphomicrobiales bacterium]
DQVVQDTDQSANQVGRQISALSEISTTVLGEVSTLADRFEGHAQTLTEATRLLETANRSLETSVDSRSSALHGMVAELGDKTKAIETQMREFTEVIAETLSTAEQRADELGRTLASTALGAAKGVAEEFDKLRLTAGLEGQKASEAVHAAREQMISEMTEALGSATERFATAAKEMRNVAREMQRELESTRAEIKRGVLDLPEETKTSTAAMRRVVSEQIRALNELSEIVARHAGPLDVARPAATVSAGAAPRAATAERGGNVRRRPEAPAQERREPAATVADVRPTRSVEPEAGGNDPRQQARGGWVSDLLRRASHEDEQPAKREPAPAPEPGNRGDRSPLHMVESLNSLSVDIARAIDHAASVDLWERYQRGERNVFTRRLYTLQGQRTFDEIRRKYQRDAEFRSAVDRYIEDFEKLISEVSRNDRDNILTQTYLTSDT